MATALEDFSSWLSRTLQELNTDESVFGSYILSIVDSDESPDEQNEALQGILSEIIENEKDLSQLCDEILEKWEFHKRKEPPPVAVAREDVDAKLVKLLESQSLAITKQKKYTDEERKIRDAILSQYSQMTDDEDEGNEVSQPGDIKEKSEKSIEKNTNAQSVLQAEKVKREQAKLDSQKKKDKDKEDREKQKQLREEKKEKRKTQKGERRR